MKISKFQWAKISACLSLIMLIFATGCSGTRIVMEDVDLAKIRKNESILVFPPLTSNPRWNTVSESLGEYYSVEVPKRVNGPVIYSGNIESLKNVQTWNNLIKNGSVNTMEAAAIGKSVGCNSVLTCQILEWKPYPPFRMVVNLMWIDTSSNVLLGKLYQEVDLADSETNYRFSNFAGQGPARELYEKVWYSKDLYQTSYLMPKDFFRFTAAYSTRVLFGETQSFPWWYFWRTL